MVNTNGITDIGNLIVVFQDMGLIGLQGDLFGRAVGEHIKFGITHGRHIYGSGTRGFMVELKELNNGVCAYRQQMMAQFRILVKVKI